MVDWIREIVIAFKVKEKIAEVDRDELWRFAAPELAATDEQVHYAEEQLGFRLDTEYREFLRKANGWKAFYQDVSILGTPDLVGTENMHRAKALVVALEDLKPVVGFESSELLPVAVSETDIDVFLIRIQPHDMPAEVFWFAGRLIERFASFSEFFLAMVDYNRQEFDQLADR